MRELATVLTVMLKNTFRSRKGSKAGSPILIYAIMGISFALFSTMSAIGMQDFFAEIGKMNLQAEFVSFVLVVTALITVLMTATTMVSTLYYSKDNEFLLQLPIKTQTIFFAKILIVYCTQIFITVVVGLPVFIVFGITQGAGVSYYACCTVGLLVAPLFALMLVSLLAAPLVKVVSGLRNKNALTSVVSIVLMLVMMTAYYLIYAGAMQGAESMDAQQVLQMLAQPIKTVAAIFIPFTAIGQLGFALPATPFGAVSNPYAIIINLALVLAFIAVFVALAVIISSFFYKKGVTAMLEYAKEKKKSTVKENTGKRKSLFATFFVLEWKNIIRDPSFAMNCLGTICILPVMPLFMLFSTEAVEGFDMFLMLYAMITGMAITLNLGACTAFTREGEKIALIKSAPIDAKSVIKAKVAFNALTVTVAYFISVVVAVLVTKSNPLFLLTALGGLPILLGFCEMDVYFDLKKPNLTWINSTEALKTNKNVMVVTLVSMGVMLVMVGAATILTVAFAGWLGVVIYCLVQAAVGIVFVCIFSTLLAKKGNAMLENMQV